MGESARLIAALLLGIAIGANATWALQNRLGTQVEILEGQTTIVNQDRTATGSALGRDDAAKSYSIVGATWREAGGLWDTSGPTCVGSDTSGQQVRIGLLKAEPRAEAPGRETVVWLECLDLGGPRAGTRPPGRDRDPSRKCGRPGIPLARDESYPC